MYIINIEEVQGLNPGEHHILSISMMKGDHLQDIVAFYPTNMT